MALKNVPPMVATLDTRIAAPAPTESTNGLYTSTAWRSLMAKLKADRGERCQECGRGRCRIFGDHIRELKDGGAPLDPDNVQMLCGACHTAKTIAARARRMATRPARLAASPIARP